MSDAETKDAQEILNYEQAIEEWIKTLDTDSEISVELLHDLHKTLLTNVLEDRTVATMLDIERSTAYRAIYALEEEVRLLEEVTGKQRNKEYRAKEILEILERPPQTY